MKIKSKEILSSANYGKILSNQESANLKKVQMMILEDIVFVCKKYSLNYSLCFGSLLGAVRHEGYIPWDDDIDICLFPKEIDRLIEKMTDEYGDKYFFTGYGRTLDPCFCLKVNLKGTLLIENDVAYTDFIRGISVDVFPIIVLNNKKKTISRAERKLRFLTHFISLSSEWKWKRIGLLKSDIKSIQRYYRFRRFVGFFVSFLGYERLLKKRQLIYKKYEKNANDFSYTLIGFNQKNKNDSLTVDECKKTIAYNFENKSFSGFKFSDKFLKLHFGDSYMDIPDVKNREKHSIFLIDFGKYGMDFFNS